MAAPVEKTTIDEWRLLCAREAEHLEILEKIGCPIGERGRRERQCFDDMVRFFDLIGMDAEAHREIIRRRLRATAPRLAEESEQRRN
jgi:hypothetical protein